MGGAHVLIEQPPAGGRIPFGSRPPAVQYLRTTFHDFCELPHGLALGERGERSAALPTRGFARNPKPNKRPLTSVTTASLARAARQAIRVIARRMVLGAQRVVSEGGGVR